MSGSKMKQSFLSVGLVLASLSSITSMTYAAKTPNSLITDHRVKQVMFDPNQVYEVIGNYGYQTTLEFGAAEKIKVAAVGDTIAWQVVPYMNRLFIKPVEANATTNMTVITDQHTYYFRLRGAKNARDATFLVRFVYGSPHPGLYGGGAPRTVGLTASVDPAKLNLDYG